MTTELLDYSRYFWTQDTLTTKRVESTPAGHYYIAFRANRLCPFCSAPAKKVLDGVLRSPDYDLLHTIDIWGCTACGWWISEFLKDDDPPLGMERFRRCVAYLRRFQVHSADLPLQTLSHELLRRPDVLRGVSPTRFEAFVGAILADFFNVDVRVVGRSGDGGLDLVYVDGDEPFAIQVKRRESGDDAEGVSLVREFLGACVLSDFRHGKVVTTARAFTRGARRAARVAVDKRIMQSFELIDGRRFLEMFRCTGYAHRYPWTPLAIHWLEAWGANGEFSAVRELIV